MPFMIYIKSWGDSQKTHVYTWRNVYYFSRGCWLSASKDDGRLPGGEHSLKITGA